MVLFRTGPVSYSSAFSTFGREDGREREREGGREESKEGGREGGREGWREGGRKTLLLFTLSTCHLRRAKVRVSMCVCASVERGRRRGVKQYVPL